VEEARERHSITEKKDADEATKFGEELDEEEKAAAMRRAESIEEIVEKQAHLQGQE
jgi:hypothetical protein